MSFRALERWLLLIIMFVNLGVIDALTRPTVAGRDPELISTDVPVLTATMVSAAYLFGLLLVLRRSRAVLTAAQKVWPLVFLALFAFLSVLWSNAPLLTVRRSVFLMASTLLGVYLGERFSIEELAQLLVNAFCPMMLAVLVLYAVAPSYVVDPLGAWKGLSGAKNTFGGYIGIAVPLLLLVRFQRFYRSRYFFLILAVALLVLSRSATALVTCILSILAIPLWRFAGRQKKLFAYTSVSVAMVLGSLLIWLGRAPILRFLGRDATLSGRTHLWSLVTDAILKHPLLGYGYGAFWTGINADTLNIYMGTQWLPAGSDNGYLDLCLAFGILGSLFFLYVYARSFKSAHSYVAVERRWIGLWPITYVLYFGIHNLCESHLLTTRSIDFLIFAAITTSLAVSHRAARDSVPAPATARRLSYHPTMASIAAEPDTHYS